jgi:hypothetical protein
VTANESDSFSFLSTAKSLPVRLVPEATTIVVVGAWNPAILTPEWLLRRAFGAEGAGDEEVGIEWSPSSGIPATYLIRGVYFHALSRRLTVRPATVTEDSLNLAGRCVRNVLEALPHTPVSAFGHNFSFVEDDADADHLDVFNGIQDIAALPFQYEP